MRVCARRAEQEFGDGEYAKDEVEEYAGLLGHQREANGNAHKRQAQRSRPLDVAIERVYGGEHHAGECHVGGDETAVSEHHGFEGEEGECQQARPRPEHLASSGEDRQSEAKGEKQHHAAAARKQRVGVRSVESRFPCAINTTFRK